MIMWQMTSCATGQLTVVDMGTKEWIEIILAAIFGAVGIISYLNNRAISNEKTTNLAFREDISRKIDNSEKLQKERDVLIVEQLSQMSTTLSSELRGVIDSVKEVRKDMKESMTMYEENREMNVKQQEAIDTLKEDVKDIEHRVLDLERRIK